MSQRAERFEAAGSRMLTAMVACLLVAGTMAGCGGTNQAKLRSPPSGERGPGGHVGIEKATVPNLVGLALPQAQCTADEVRLFVGLAAEKVSTSVPAGTVIAQTVPPGRPTAAVAGVELTVAVAPAPPCAADQLRLTSRGGSPATGNDFDTLDFRNVSPRWCFLAGSVSVVGSDAAGRPVTNVVALSVDRHLELSPRTPPPTSFQPPLGAIPEDVLLESHVRDDSEPYGLCPNLVVPVAWTATLPDGEALAVRNGSATTPSIEPFTACGGRIGGQVEGSLGISP